MAEILHQLIIKTATSDVYRALTEAKGLTNWWTRHAIVEPRVESIAKFSFNHGETVLRIKILRLIPQKLVAWHCLGGQAEWEDTQIIFELKPVAKQTVLYFTHRGWQSTTGLFPQANFDWGRYLLSLRAYLEKGRGYPARD